nr:Gag-pre-integrase domain, Gag-polypeptide of LTR copia-type [Tanacetum cinerariifolium]
MKHIEIDIHFVCDMITVGQLRSIWDEAQSIWDEAQSIYPFPRCSCNKCVCDVRKKINEHQENEHLYEFLMRLHAEFIVIRTQILATKSVPSLETAYHMVVEDERKRSVSNENINPHGSAAFKAFQRRNGPPSSNKERSGTKAVKEGIEHCTECNKDGLRKDTRPVANMSHKEDEEGEWKFDSGCTEYITYLSNILVNKKATHFKALVVIPNEDSIQIKGKGDYVLSGGTKVNGFLYVSDFVSLTALGLQKRNFIGAWRCQGGLYRMKIIHGRKVMATTVKTWHRRLGHALKGKLDKASKCLKIFHKMIEVQFEKQIKRVRCDNGGEFTSKDMLEFYNEKEILLESTCPHTPQQNGVVERKHRQLIKTARALRIGANLPKRFWGECILTAAHVINRLLSKVFRCLVYFKNTDTKGDKFEEKGKPRVFLGYPPRTKGYKILDLETRKIIVSRDVNFHEENFLFKNVQGNNKSGNEELIICHDCHCHGKPILAQNKEQNPMEQDPQMDHNQNNEPSGSHETHDGDETGQINDEGQPNNDEFETNESNEGAEANVETRPT